VYKKIHHLESIRDWYARFERPISSISLLGGFVFDAVTLKRVDTLWENLWILGHIFIVTLFIALIYLSEGEEGDEANPSKKHFWYVNILQFFFGGILSTYLVFYFRSSDLFSTWPFILLLALAFWANESLKRHYIRFSFQISLLFLSIYSFAIFILPVILHRINMWIFLLSGIVSLASIYAFVEVLSFYKKRKKKLIESKRLISFLVLSIFGVVNFLYFTNLIPPLPLSIKDAGIYHALVKNPKGDYVVTEEEHGILGYFEIFKNFNKNVGSNVYAYTAVFSPSKLDPTIVHEWQYFDKDKLKWYTDSVISLPVVGGRDGGFRTYSMRSDLTLGKWRVNIKTENGQVIGRIRFNVVKKDTLPILKSEVKI
jgi:hypothetical protein